MKRIVFSLLVLIVSGSVCADDLVQPEWRGDPGSTYTRWEFLTDNTDPTPEEQNNPFGGARLHVFPTHPWEQMWGGRDGVWALSGLIDLEIDNTLNPEPVKYVQIQLTWAGQYDSPAAVPTPTIAGELENGTPVEWELLNESTIDLEPTGVAGADPDWHHTTYLYALYPNPIIDYIDIGGSIWVDELVVDTICIPEPMTLVLLGMGGLLLRKRK